MEDCIFCKIIKGDLPSSKIYEDESILAFLDIFPVNEGHILIIPKQHQQFMEDLDDEVLGKMMVMAKKIIKSYNSLLNKPDGVNLFLANGETAGQEVFHTHLHLIPRFKNDNVGQVFAGKTEKNFSKEDLDDIAEKIKLNLK